MMKPSSLPQKVVLVTSHRPYGKTSQAMLTACAMATRGGRYLDCLGAGTSITKKWMSLIDLLERNGLPAELDHLYHTAHFPGGGTVELRHAQPLSTRWKRLGPNGWEPAIEPAEGRETLPPNNRETTERKT